MIGEDILPINELGIGNCEGSRGAACACMILKPLPAEAMVSRGFVVVADACLAYENLYPDGVECRDARWVRLSP